MKASVVVVVMVVVVVVVRRARIWNTMEEGRLVAAALHRGGNWRRRRCERISARVVCSAIGRTKPCEAPVIAWGSLCLCLRSGLRHLYLLDPHLSPPTTQHLLPFTLPFPTCTVRLPCSLRHHLADQVAAPQRHHHESPSTLASHALSSLSLSSPHFLLTTPSTVLYATATMRRSSSISSMSSSSSESEETMQIFVKTVSGSNSKSFPPPFRASEQVASCSHNG
jgi:hypothetical protein